jgi:hypothetical protein
MEKKYMKKTAIFMLCLGIVFLTQLQNSFAQDSNVIFEEGDSITVSGAVEKIKMTNFDDNPWEEVGLKDDAGKIFILIGKSVEQILALVNKPVTVTGIIMPSMTAKGQLLPVIQVEDFKALE